MHLGAEPSHIKLCRVPPPPREEQPTFGLHDISKARALIGQLLISYYFVIGNYTPTNKHANSDFTGCSLKMGEMNFN